MSSAEGVVEVGGNEINERDVFYAPFTCESEQDFQIERSNQTASRNNSILKRTHPLEALFKFADADRQTKHRASRFAKEQYTGLCFECFECALVSRVTCGKHVVSCQKW